MAFRGLLKTATALACLSALAAGVGFAPARAEDKITIIMDAGPLWDPFFGAMKKGADDAAHDLGVDYQWVTGTDPNNFLADYAKLVKQSASRHPSALVIGNYFPDTLDPIIKEITASGIPVVVFHDGGATWKQDGAIGYVGFSARDLGRSVAELEIKAGAKHGLCVNHVPGNTTLELDCAGYDDAFKAAGGSSKVLMIQFSDASNAALVTQAIKGQLQADPTLDAVWTIGAAQAVELGQRNRTARQDRQDRQRLARSLAWLAAGAQGRQASVHRRPAALPRWLLLAARRLSIRQIWYAAARPDLDRTADDHQGQRRSGPQDQQGISGCARRVLSATGLDESRARMRPVLDCLRIH